jgi:hypothetical protein
VGVDASMISKWERGEKRPRRLYRNLLCALYEANEYQLALRSRPDPPQAQRVKEKANEEFHLDELDQPSFRAGGILEDAREALSDRSLFLSGRESTHPMLALAGTPVVDSHWSRAQEAANCDVLSDHLRDMWHALVRTDNLLGPKHALGGVLDNIAAVQAVFPRFHDHEKLRLVDWAAQFAESAAWLYEDLRQLPQAAGWIDRAHGWAVQTGNEPMTTWTVVGRARQALERGDPGAALPLAQAAERGSRSVSPRMRAAALCSEAEAHASLGDEVACHRALDLAERYTDADGPDERGDAVAGGHGSFCTTDYIAAHRGRCWLKLGRPDRSLPLYLDGLRTRPTVYQRDRGWDLAGLAATHLALGDAELAAMIASEALQIGITVGSARTVQEALRVVRELPHAVQSPETEYLLGTSGAGT